MLITVPKYGAPLNTDKGIYFKQDKSGNTDLNDYKLSELSTHAEPTELLKQHNAGERSFATHWLVQINLSGAMLFSIHFGGANLVGADLSRAVLTKSHLSFADLFMANLSSTDLS